MHIDFIGDDGVSQRLLQLRCPLHFLGDFARIDRDLATTAPLGPIESRIGAFQQVLEIVPGKGIDSKAEGCGETDIALPEIEGRRQDLLQHASDFFGCLALEHQRKHEGKFVAAVANDRRPIRDARQKPVGNLTEDGISGFGAKKIVDRLEPIQIGKTDCEGGRVTRPLGSNLAHLVAQGIGISKPRKRIGIGHRLEIAPTEVLRRPVSIVHHAFPHWTELVISAPTMHFRKLTFQQHSVPTSDSGIPSSWGLTVRRQNSLHRGLP